MFRFSAVTLIVTVFLTSAVQAKDKNTLIFGAIAVSKASHVMKRFEPLINYLKKATGKKIIFKTSKTYDEAIDKFLSGEYDLGWLAPASYVLATRKSTEKLEHLAVLETKGKPYYYGIIITAKNSPIKTMNDIKGKKFGFGSKRSTLSFYVPAYNLIKDGVFPTLKEYKFFGKHDNVVKNILLGKVDAGGVKEAIFNKYKDKLKIIKKSDAYYDFMVVAHKTMEPALKKQFKDLLLTLKDKDILNSVKKGATGFVPNKHENYLNLITVMESVEKHVKPE